jgi:hypothetical protein
MDTSVKTVRQLEQVFEPHRMILKELKEKNTKNTKTLFWGRGGEKVNYSRIVAFRGRSWSKLPAKSQG